MAEIDIEGLGRFAVDDAFFKLPADRQAAEVDALVAAMRPQAPAVPGGSPAVRAQMAPASGGGDMLDRGVAAAGRVAQRAGKVAADRFGDRELGISEASIQDLVERGVIAGKGQSATPIQLLNQLVYQYGSKAGDLALRSIAAVIGAGQGAAGQTAEELGASPGMARRLERDTGMIADTAGVVSGTTPVPRAPRAVAAAEAVPEGPLPSGGVGVNVGRGDAAGFEKAAKKFYNETEQAGVVIPNSEIRVLAGDVRRSAGERLDPTITPNANAAVGRIEQLAREGTPVTFEKLEIMRQIANDARQTAKAGTSDATLAGNMVNRIDEFVENLKPAQVAGDIETVQRAIPIARQLWSTARKLDDITEMVRRATLSSVDFSGKGLEGALRTEFKNLAKSKERMKTYTADERAAIEHVAYGTIPSRAARAAGRLAPTNIVSGTLGPGLGAAIGTYIGVGPVAGAAAAGGIGFVGRTIATKMIQSHIARLENIVRQGGNIPVGRAEESIRRAIGLLADMGVPAAVGGTAANTQERLQQRGARTPRRGGLGAPENAFFGVTNG